MSFEAMQRYLEDVYVVSLEQLDKIPKTLLFLVCYAKNDTFRDSFERLSVEEKIKLILNYAEVKI